MGKAISNKQGAMTKLRIKINGWIFLITGSISLLIAFVTVSIQAVRAAMANPVKSLRTE
jgi:putative ABC transport system permease protein